MDPLEPTRARNFRYIQEGDGPPRELPPEPDPVPEAPAPLTPEDLQIEVSIQFRTGRGPLDRVTKTVVLRELLGRHRLATSEAAVAEVTGRDLIEPIRALVRSELFHRFGKLPGGWLEGQPDLVDWYEQCRLAQRLDRGLHDKLQWGRIHRAGRSLEELLARRIADEGGEGW